MGKGMESDVIKSDVKIDVRWTSEEGGLNQKWYCTL